MAPFYEGENKLRIGELKEIAEGSSKGLVKVVSDTTLFVTPEPGSWLFAGSVNLITGNFKEEVQKITREKYLKWQSVSSNERRPKIVFRRK